MVLATAVPKTKAARKLNAAAQNTASRGESTRVETTVAMLLAASWKPLMKSNASAMRIETTTSNKLVCNLVSLARKNNCGQALSSTSGALQHYAFNHIGGVFSFVGCSLQHLIQFLELDQGNWVL